MHSFSWHTKCNPLPRCNHLELYSISQCTYAPSSKGACYSCHVRADGNAPHPPDVNDVDCLMCHSDTYQRKTVASTTAGTPITDIYGNIKTYFFSAQDAQGNYTTVPAYALMPAGTTMESLEQNVHKPTKASCLRCHAKAGGGDWTKRGDMGLSTKNPTVTEDVHMSSAAGGNNMTCTECHATTGKTVDGTKMIPLGKLGYHTWPAKVASCTLCHSAKTATWEAMHNKHAASNGGEVKLACASCHTSEPTGLVKPTSDLCNDCHSSKTWSNSQELHGKHIEKAINV